METSTEVASLTIPKEHRSETSITMLPAGRSSCLTSKQFALHRQCKSDDQRLVVTVPSVAGGQSQWLGHKQAKSDDLLSQYKPPPSYYVFGRGSLRGGKSQAGSSQNKANTLGGTNGARIHPNTGSQSPHLFQAYSTTPVVYISKDVHKGNVAQCHFVPLARTADRPVQQMGQPSHVPTQEEIIQKLIAEMPVGNIADNQVTLANRIQSLMPMTKYSPKHQMAIARFHEELEDTGYSTISREHRKTIHTHSQRMLQPVTDDMFYPGSRGFQGSTTMPTASVSEPSSVAGTLRTDHEAIATRAAHMVGILSEENKSLRHELDGLYMKVSKLQKFEQDIHRVQTDHEMLVESTRKREQLEVVYKWKLENEIKRLQQYNRHLIAKLERLSALYQSKESVDSMGKSETGELHTELSKRDAVIVELAHQRQEADVNYQRMEEELAAQRATLDEQRLHIEVLDNALSNAQTNVVKLQEECKRRQIFMEKATDLQRLVTSLQKRVESESKVRSDMEKELQTLKGDQRNNLQDEGVSGLEENGDSVTLVGLLKEREQTILRLEADVCKWEHLYYEQCAQFQTMEGRQEWEESGEKAAEYSLSVQRIGMLEARVGTLQAELKQKDTLVQVLRQQILERDTALPSPTSSRPQSVSPHSSLQNIRRNSIESLQNRSSPTASSSSLQSLVQRSPHSSNQNLAMGSSSSTRSPVASMQNLTLASRSPLGSQQNLVFVRGPVIQMGSQERIAAGDSPSFLSSMAPSGMQLAGPSNNESNLTKERDVLDEKLRLLDQEIMERDRILDHILN